MKQNVRYGGEEFVIVLPSATLRLAITVADHNHRAVMAKESMKRSRGERLGHVTISIGVTLMRTDDTSQSLIERADNCLHAVKRQGVIASFARVTSEVEPRTNPETTPPAQIA